MLADLLPGTYELKVRAVNALGSVDATPAVHTWTVVPPETTIDSGPLASTLNVDAEFTFSSNDPEAAFECALDNEAFSSCSSPLQLTGAPGRPARAEGPRRQLGGHVRPDAGELPVDDPGAARDGHHRPAGRPDREQHRDVHVRSRTCADATFECALDEAADSGTFTPCSSPITYTGLVFGEHAFAVRAVDSDGNTELLPAEWEWSIEGPAPPVLITSGPDVTTDSRTARFDF